MRESETVGQTATAALYYQQVTQKFHGNRIFISRMLNRNPNRLSAEVFSSAQKQPKQNTSSQNREENGSTTLRNTREKPLLAGYCRGICKTDMINYPTWMRWLVPLHLSHEIIMLLNTNVVSITLNSLFQTPRQ